MLNVCNTQGVETSFCCNSVTVVQRQSRFLMSYYTVGLPDVLYFIYIYICIHIYIGIIYRGGGEGYNPPNYQQCPVRTQ